jgi:hypothetical protein
MPPIPGLLPFLKFIGRWPRRVGWAQPKKNKQSAAQRRFFLKQILREKPCPRFPVCFPFCNLLVVGRAVLAGRSPKRQAIGRAAPIFLKTEFTRKTMAPASLCEIYWSLAAPCWLGAAQKKQAISRAAPIFFKTDFTRKTMPPIPFL